eukprot:358374-Chlamydomonas_euryale.AAC.5
MQSAKEQRWNLEALKEETEVLSLHLQSALSERDALRRRVVEQGESKELHELRQALEIKETEQQVTARQVKIVNERLDQELFHSKQLCKQVEACNKRYTQLWNDVCERRKGKGNLEQEFREVTCSSTQTDDQCFALAVDLKAEIAGLLRENALLNSRISELETQLCSQTKASKNAQIACADQEALNVQLAAQLSRSTGKNNKLETALEDAQGKLHGAKMELSILERKYMRSVEEGVDQKERISELDGQLDKLADIVSDAEMELDEMQHMRAEDAAALEQARCHAEWQAAELTQWRERLEAISNAKHAFEFKSRTTLQSIAQQEAELAAMQGKHDVPMSLELSLKLQQLLDVWGFSATQARTQESASTTKHCVVDAKTVGTAPLESDEGAFKDQQSGMLLG